MNKITRNNCQNKKRMIKKKQVIKFVWQSASENNFQKSTTLTMIDSNFSIKEHFLRATGKLGATFEKGLGIN